MKIDITAHVSKCVQCAQHKGTVSKPAPILQYPPPAGPWDVVAIDLLQLLDSNQGSWYLLLCVDNFSRFVIFAPLQNKTAEAVVHVLISNLFFPYSTPRVGRSFVMLFWKKSVNSLILSKRSQLLIILQAMGLSNARTEKFSTCYAPL